MRKKEDARVPELIRAMGLQKQVDRIAARLVALERIVAAIVPISDEAVS